MFYIVYIDYIIYNQNIPKIFTDGEIQSLLNALSQPYDFRDDDIGLWVRSRNLAIFNICYHSALRPKEVLCIKLTDIDLKQGVIHIPPEGNKLYRGRDVPLSEKARPYLMNYLLHLSKQYWNFSPYLFPSLHNPRLSSDRWSEIMRQARIQAGIYVPREKTCYALRHTKATEVYMKTHDSLTVANLLGHKSLESTKIYIHTATMKDGYMNYLRNLVS
jgi:integrase